MPRAKVSKIFRNTRSVPNDRSNILQSVSRPELLVDGSDCDFNQLVLGISTLRSLLHGIRERNGLSAGLGGLEYTALATLARVSPRQEIGVQELAGMLRLSGAFVTSVVNRLVDMGLVTKSPHPVDRRRIRLRPTDQAIGLLTEIGPLQRQVNDIAFESLTAAEFRQLCELVQRLIGSTEGAMAFQDYLTKAQPPLDARASKAASRRHEAAQ